MQTRITTSFTLDGFQFRQVTTITINIICICLCGFTIIAQCFYVTIQSIWITRCNTTWNTFRGQVLIGQQIINCSNHNIFWQIKIKSACIRFLGCCEGDNINEK